MTNQELLDHAAKCGFEHYGLLNISALKFEPAVRDMCAENRCGMYGHCWTCPPGCGSLEDCSAKVSSYATGILLQSTGQMDDDFDLDTIMDTMTLQKKRFEQYVAEIRMQEPQCLPMSTGTCTICSQCTYPDAPCRFPELAIPSMEAYGLVVSQVCESSALPYYYGPKTITYTACVLI